jgi:hypothetical protein
MRVSLINGNLVAEDPVGTCIINQVQFFRRRGDDARVYVLHQPHDAPPDVEAVTSSVTLEELTGGTREHFRLSDLYIYHYSGHYALMESIRGIARGTVIFYYHNVIPPELRESDIERDSPVQDIEGSALVHYADWCITSSPFNKQDLTDRVGYAPDRIYVLPLAVSSKQFTPGDRDPELVRRHKMDGQRVKTFSLEQYEAHLAEIVNQAVTYTLPEIPSELAAEESEDTQGEPISTTLQDELVLNIITDEIKARSDIAIRGYVVRSRMPLVGPFIAWVRRNLTSHLREPYLDPMIEHQVILNHRVAEWMKRATSAWTTATRRQTELEARVETLETQVEALTRRLNEDEPSEKRT